MPIPIGRITSRKQVYSTKSSGNKEDSYSRIQKIRATSLSAQESDDENDYSKLGQGVCCNGKGLRNGRVKERSGYLVLCQIVYVPAHSIVNSNRSQGDGKQIDDSSNHQYPVVPTCFADDEGSRVNAQGDEKSSSNSPSPRYNVQGGASIYIRW